MANPPRAKITVDCVRPFANAPCDPDPAKRRTRVFSPQDATAAGETVSWDFGDGGTATTSSVPHEFSEDGTYVVSLTIVNSISGLEATDIANVPIGSSADMAKDDDLTAELGTNLRIDFRDLLLNDDAGLRFDGLDSQLAGLTLWDGFLLYVPSAVGVVQFVYRASNGLEADTATVTITVVRPDPVANDDFYSTGINVPLYFKSAHLLENDSPGAKHISSFPEVIYGTGGTAVYSGQSNVDGSRKYTFTPTYGFKGTASFPYSISWDGQPPYVTGTVYVEVVDRGPWADFTPTCVNRSCSITYNNAGDDVGITNYTFNWGDGATTSSGQEHPQPHEYAASGRFVITQTVADGAGHSSNLMIQNPPPVIDAETHPAQQAYLEYPPGRTDARMLAAVEVVANTRPVAVDDSLTTERDIAVIVDFVANDVDPDPGAVLSPVIDFASLFATYPGLSLTTVPCAPPPAACNPNLRRILPPDTFLGVITIPYKVSDGLAESANTATITLEVTQWKSVLDAVGEQFAMPQNGFPLIIQKGALLANDYNEDDKICLPGEVLPNCTGDVKRVAGYDASILMGALVDEGAWFRYTPPINGAGTTFFRYTLEDGAGHRETAEVRIYVGYPNPAPTAVDDRFTNLSRATKTFTRQEVVQNDIDPWGDVLTIINLAAATYGTVSCTNPMYDCTYTPFSGPSTTGAGYVGTHRFMYQSWDLLNPAVPAYIHMLTLPTPDPKTFDAREDVLFASTFVQMTISYAGLKANDYAPPGAQPITITAASIDKTGLQGTMTCDTTSCLYKSPAGFSGLTRFKYTATDSQGKTDTAIVTIRVGTVANAAPVVGPQEQFTTTREAGFTFSVFELLKNDYDPDNDPLTVTMFQFYPEQNRQGHLDCGTPSYWCTYTPELDPLPRFTTETITYTVSDGTTSTSSSIKINFSN